MDADNLIKAGKEARSFHIEDSLRCSRCLRLITPYAHDANGDAIYDKHCSACLNVVIRGQAPADPFPVETRRHCNRCYDRIPLRGIAWCGVCALKFNESLRGDEDDKSLNARIQYLQARSAAEPRSGLG